jgi:hypothetical protein
MTNELPRGISPELLISQIKNTMPYLFEGTSAINTLEPTQIVFNKISNPDLALSHVEYFKLCYSAHVLTVGTPVPTDVDNQIRQKLWPKNLPLELALEMTDFVIKSVSWDFTLLSDRFQYGKKNQAHQFVSGHQGEWFTVATGAYCALAKYSSSEAQNKKHELFLEIKKQIELHAEVFASLWREQDGIGCLKAASSIAHNFGDLDRVMDMWELDGTDPLRRDYYKLTAHPFDHKKELRFMGRLWVAGELYKSKICGSSLALENHRHYALRKIRALRNRPDFMIPTAPFFDSWGNRLAQNTLEYDVPPLLNEIKLAWDKQKGTVAYGRAICGILEKTTHVSTSEWTLDQEQKLTLETPKVEFEKKWNDEALVWLDEIPSTAQ